MPENIFSYLCIGNHTRQGTPADAGHAGESSIVKWLWIPAFAGMTPSKNKMFYQLLPAIHEFKKREQTKTRTKRRWNKIKNLVTYIERG